MATFKILLTWTENPGGWLEASVRAKDHVGLGEYVFMAQPRPAHCDRGSWLVYVDSRGVASLDGQEDFPRYYFKLENLKDEIELWVNKREECHKAL